MAIKNNEITHSTLTSHPDNGHQKGELEDGKGQKKERKFVRNCSNITEISS